MRNLEVDHIDCVTIVTYDGFSTAPPERFDYEMKSNKFFLFLNANGISYEVCRKLEGERLH